MDDTDLDCNNDAMDLVETLTDLEDKYPEQTV